MQRTHLLLFLALTLPLLATFARIGSAAPARPFPAVADLPAHTEMPDPLVLFNGKRVTTKTQWLKERRPELKELFQYYMYGYLPPRRKVESATPWVNKRAFDGKATLKEIIL